MTIEVYMPALSPTMEKGTLAKWLVKEGDSVAAGDIIAEIETDKATMEVESIDDGTVGRIVIEEGSEDVPVGDLIAVLLEEGEDESALEEVESPKPKKQEAAESPTESGSETRSEDAETKSEEEPSDTEPKDGKTVADTPEKADGKAPPASQSDEGERILASPLARRMAKQAGIDLNEVEGSGPKGRIVKADIESFRSGAPAGPTETAPSAGAEPAQPHAPPADIPYEEIKLSGMRKVIARRMTESKTSVPHFYLNIDVALDRLMTQRAQLNERLADQGIKISVNDFIIKASALALKKVPAANAMYAGEKMYRFQRQDISVAVAVDDGLITPVIRDAGSKGLAEIAQEMKELAKKAREGKLMPEEYQGGTFSISNLGMYGIRDFGAVINPPQGAILAVGAGEKRAVIVDDAVAIRRMMTVTLSVDHRALDGAIGAEFLKEFKTLIEDPVMMLL